MTAQQKVEEILGNGDRSAGRAIVNFVNEALALNREELRRLSGEHNERVAAFENRVADFASAGDLERVQGDVNDINRRLATAAAALGGAVTAHNQAIDNATSTNVEAAQVASTEVSVAGTDMDARIEGLETRVSRLEERADDHEERIVRLEGRVEPIHIAQPAAMQPEPAPVATPTRVQVLVAQANPSSWKGPWPWVIAIVGLVVGWLLGAQLTELSNPTMWDWMAWLAQPIVAAIGFFGGGVIGTKVAAQAVIPVRT